MTATPPQRPVPSRETFAMILAAIHECAASTLRTPSDATALKCAQAARDLAWAYRLLASDELLPPIPPPSP